MGADSRIYNLANELSETELSAKKATLEIAIDDPAYTGTDPARKLKLATLLASGDLSTETDDDSRALSVKGFYDNVATDSKKGVIKEASQAELSAATTSTAVTSKNFKTALLAQGLIIIDASNKSTFVDSTLPANTVDVELVYSKIGNRVHISGTLNPNIVGNAAIYQIWLKNIEMPNSDISIQAGHANYTDGSGYYSSAVNIVKEYGSPDLLRLTFYPQRGYTFASASEFILGLTYTTDGL